MIATPPLNALLGRVAEMNAQLRELNGNLREVLATVAGQPGSEDQPGEPTPRERP